MFDDDTDDETWTWIEFDVKLLTTLCAEALQYKDVNRLSYMDAQGYFDSHSPNNLYLAEIIKATTGRFVW